MSTSARKILDALPGIKQDEIKPCAICQRGIAHDGNFLFWRLAFDRAGIDASAVSRHAGLEQMLGTPLLARAMGVDADIARVIDGPHQVWICEPCVTAKLAPLFYLAEAEAENEKAEAAAQQSAQPQLPLQPASPTPSSQEPPRPPVA